MLAGPLMIWVRFRPIQEVHLVVEDPSNDSEVDGNSDKGAEHLREEHGLGWDVHVMSKLLILQQVLSSIPGVSGNRPIY